jgi:hypothetical protein
VVVRANGTTDFSVLQNELKGKSKSIVMIAFDLLSQQATICGSCRSRSGRRI